MTAATPAVTAFIGLGSNLAGPEQQVLDALGELAQLPGSRLTGQSSLYRSSPVGPDGQPDYINAVAMLETTLSPETLLDELQAIEHRHERVRTVRWGPRTLDLDLLLYGQQHINTARLQVPHPQMHRRAFVLLPLHEVAPRLVLPDIGSLADHLPDPPSSEIQRLADPDA